MKHDAYSQPPKRNPTSHRAHGRQVLWQITTPMLLALAIVLALAFLASASSVEDAGRWAQISVIFLIIPLVVAATLFLVVAAASAYGVFRLLKVLPQYAFQAQGLVNRMARGVRRVADISVEPFIRMRSFVAGLRSLRKRHASQK